MKFLFLLLIPVHVFGVTFSKNMDTIAGPAAHTFEITDKEAKATKSATILDERPTLGIFRLQNKDALREHSARLSRLTDRLRKVDEELRKSGLSFNKLNTPSHSYFMLGEFKIVAGTETYEMARELYEDLVDEKWVPVDAAVFSADKKQMTTFKGGKENGRKPFIPDTNCARVENQVACQVPGMGILYL